MLTNSKNNLNIIVFSYLIFNKIEINYKYIQNQNHSSKILVDQKIISVLN